MPPHVNVCCQTQSVDDDDDDDDSSEDHLEDHLDDPIERGTVQPKSVSSHSAPAPGRHHATVAVTAVAVNPTSKSACADPEEEVEEADDDDDFDDDDTEAGKTAHTRLSQGTASASASTAFPDSDLQVRFGVSFASSFFSLFSLFLLIAFHIFEICCIFLKTVSFKCTQAAAYMALTNVINREQLLDYFFRIKAELSKRARFYNLLFN